VKDSNFDLLLKWLQGFCLPVVGRHFKMERFSSDKIIAAEMNEKFATHLLMIQGLVALRSAIQDDCQLGSGESS